MKKLLKYLKGYEKECVLGPLFKLLEVVFDLMVPLVVARMINIGVAGNDRQRRPGLHCENVRRHDRTGRRGACQFGDSAVFFCCGGGGLFHTAAAYGAGAYSELKLQSGR